MKRTVSFLALGVAALSVSACLPEEVKSPQVEIVEQTPSCHMPLDSIPRTTDGIGAASAINVYAKWPNQSCLEAEPANGNAYSENYVISIDVSGSMGDRCDGVDKLTSAKAAAINFLGNIPESASVGLSIFGSRYGMLVALEPNNHADVIAAINSLSAGGGTPMSDALEVSHTSLAKAGAYQLGYGDYNLVVLGDGDPQDSNATTKWLDYMAQQTPINVTTIGFCAIVSVLDRPGVNYQSASNVAELEAAFASVLAEAEVFEDNGF